MQVAGVAVGDGPAIASTFPFKASEPLALPFCRVGDGRAEWVVGGSHRGWEKPQQGTKHRGVMGACRRDTFGRQSSP